MQERLHNPALRDCWCCLWIPQQDGNQSHGELPFPLHPRDLDKTVQNIKKTFVFNIPSLGETLSPPLDPSCPLPGPMTNECIFGQIYPIRPRVPRYKWCERHSRIVTDTLFGR